MAPFITLIAVTALLFAGGATGLRRLRPLEDSAASSVAVGTAGSTRMKPQQAPLRRSVNNLRSPSQVEQLPGTDAGSPGGRSSCWRAAAIAFGATAGGCGSAKQQRWRCQLRPQSAP